MADIVVQPVWQVLDGNGDPLAGAKARFYQAGTTTPVSAYTDSGLTVAHAVPVVADGNGVFAAVYLGSAAAKVVITKSDDSAFKTIDPLPKTTATATGASQVSFTPTVSLPATNVQAAIELVQTNLDNSSSAFSKTLLDDTTAAAWRTTLGLGALALSANVTTAEIAAGTLVTASETIASNNNDTTIPTCAAVVAAIAGLAGFYTGSTRDESVFAIGHIVAVSASGAVDRNASSTVRVDSATTTDYSGTGSGTILSGTWRGRGRMTTGNTLMQRTA